MTALREYERLEASGLWRPEPGTQRREVYVSIGEATLTVADFNSRALAHWSLAAVERANPGRVPAIFHPDGDPGETLELAESEAEMIDAIERLRRAVARSRPHRGRLRALALAGLVALLVATLVLWLPGAMRRHALTVLPAVTRIETGRTLLAEIERLVGGRCQDTPALAALARRLDTRRIVVLQGGPQPSVGLPGGLVLLRRDVIESHEDPAVAAGYVLAEATRAAASDPMEALLRDAGPLAVFALLTTGRLDEAALATHAERLLLAPRPAVDAEALAAAFRDRGVPGAPWREASGQALPDAPAAPQDAPPLLRDGDWVRLQDLCGA